MKSNLFFALAAVAVVAGCSSTESVKIAPEKKIAAGYDSADPVIGNWWGALPEPTMFASSIIISRDKAGKPEALTLYRWGHPLACADVQVKGNSFSFRHPSGFLYRGTVAGNEMYAEIAKVDRKTGKAAGEWRKFTCWRNPEIEPANTADAKFGEPIDILADGLDGFVPMSDGQLGWSFKDGVLSNRVKFDEKGKKIGAWTNIMTKRRDFYDFNLAYDVRVPKGANSGVYLRGRYEIQTVDSYGQPVNYLNMAAYYGRVTPSVAAEKPAGEWQHVDVTLYKRHLTVILNGTKIIDNAPVTGVTGGAIDANEFAAGPLYIQGDHADADYKNMILRPVVD